MKNKSTAQTNSSMHKTFVASSGLKAEAGPILADLLLTIATIE